MINYLNGKLQVVNLSRKRLSSKEYRLEVSMKIAGGKRRLYLMVKVLNSYSIDFPVYELLGHINRFLEENGIEPYDHYLPLPEHFKVVTDTEDDTKDKSNSKPNILVLENMTDSLDYHHYPLPCLDYCHTLIAVSRLARLHALSYCYKQAYKLDNLDLTVGHAVPTVDRDAVGRLENIIGDDEDVAEFIDFIRDVKQSDTEHNLETFGVFCPTNLSVENLTFSYSSHLESRMFCTCMVFQSISSACFGNCVINLLQLLFTCVDPEVRRQFMAELVCSVYYDNFVTTVKIISPNIQMFSMKCFLSEFKDNLKFGFLFGFTLCGREMRSSQELLNIDDDSHTMGEYITSVMELVKEVKMVEKKMQLNK